MIKHFWISTFLHLFAYSLFALPTNDIDKDPWLRSWLFVGPFEDYENAIKLSDSLSKSSYEVIEKFVSANPTGPLHVGHCRGAVLGDVIANVLLFNKHKVTKEYYVNDYGNQILNFTKSVYLRIREISFNEPFPNNDENLYPGDYLIDFAKNILSSNKDIDFKNFDNISEKLTDLSISNGFGDEDTSAIFKMYQQINDKNSS